MVLVTRKEGEKLTLLDRPTIPQIRRWRQHCRMAFRTMTGLGQVATDFIMMAENSKVSIEKLRCMDPRLMSGNDKLA